MKEITVTFREVAYTVVDATGREHWRFTPPPFETPDDPVRSLELVYGPRVKGSLKTRRTPDGRERSCRFKLIDGRQRNIATSVSWIERPA